MHGDRQQEFLRLFLQHQRALVGFALARGVPPSDADDAVQDIAAICWEKFDSYESGSNFRAWAFQVARFVVLRRREAAARQRRVLRVDTDTEAALLRLETDPDTGEADLPTDILHRCLAGLGRHARELLHLRYDLGLEPGDLAGRFGISAGALRVRLHRIRQHLLDCIRQHQGEEGRA